MAGVWSRSLTIALLTGLGGCARGETSDAFDTGVTFGSGGGSSPQPGETGDEGESMTSGSPMTTTAASTDGDSTGGSGDTGASAVCGDGNVDEGEECDEGAANADDGICKSDCTLQTCGDGFVGPAEDCDEGRSNAWDAACLPDCTLASCGDGHVHAGVEACDDGVNDGSYGGCMPGCGALAPHCGDAIVQQQEHCDTALPQPYPEVPCSNVCLYDFSAVPPLYCNGSCSWAGASGCDQQDADIYCRLRTGNAQSTATSFQVITALPQHGFACPGWGGTTNLGPMPEFGVMQDVWYQPTSVLDNHGAGSVVASAVCN